MKRYLPHIHWLIGTFFVFFQFTIQSSSSVLSKVWMQDFQLDHLGLSYLSASFYYTFLLVQIPVGIIYDRFPAKWVMSTAAGTLGVGCILFSMSHDFYVAILARLLMGGACAFGFMGLVKFCVTWFEARIFTFVLGVSESVSMLVVMMGMIGISWFLRHYTWRNIMFTAGVIALMMMVIVIFVVCDNPYQSPEEASETPSLISIVKQLPPLMANKQLILAGMCGFFSFAIVNAFTSLWGISFLTHTYPMDRHTAVTITSMVFVGLAVGCPLSGFITKRFCAYREIMIISIALATIMLGLGILVPGLPIWLLYIVFMLSGLFCSCYLLSFSLGKLLVPRRVRFTAMSLINLIIMVSAPILQIVIGALLAHHIFGLVQDIAWVYRIALGVLPLGMLIMLGLSFYLRNPGCEQ